MNFQLITVPSEGEAATPGASTAKFVMVTGPLRTIALASSDPARELPMFTVAACADPAAMPAIAVATTSARARLLPTPLVITVRTYSAGQFESSDPGAGSLPRIASRNGKQSPPRPQIEIKSSTASPEEAAAIAAALERFLWETAPAPTAAEMSRWQCAALREGVEARSQLGGGWGPC
jgi:hypothetical protein